MAHLEVCNKLAATIKTSRDEAPLLQDLCVSHKASKSIKKLQFGNTFLKEESAFFKLDGDQLEAGEMQALALQNFEGCDCLLVVPASLTFGLS